MPGERSQRSPAATSPIDPAEAHDARAGAAIRWSVSGQLGVQAMRLGFGVVLARLLSPHEFGLLALVTVLTQFMTSVADVGFEDALVQQRELEERHRSSVFWATVGLGAALSLGTFLAAPAIARFYAVGEVRPLVELLAALFLLRSIGIVPRALLARRLAFRRLIAIEAGAAAAAGLVGVGLAAGGFGVASLAAQLLAATALESLLLWRASAWRPALALRGSALGELVGLSAYRVATRTLGYWGQHLDQLLVGKLIGVGPLGLYERAYTLIRFPVLYVSRAVARATFPSLSGIQEDAARMRALHLRTTGAVALVTFPLCTGLFASAHPLVTGVLGDHWRDAVPLVRILTVASLVQSVATLTSSLYLSQGRTDLHFRMNLLQSLSMIAAVVVGRYWGVTGVAVGYTVGTMVTALPTLWVAGRLVALPLRSLVAHLRPVFLASLTMALVVLGLGATAGAHVGALPLLAGEIAAGVVTYLAALQLFRAEPLRDVLDALRRSARAGTA
jgi:PST family polysaccharide transporter